MLASEGGAERDGDFVVVEAFDGGHPGAVASDGIGDACACRHVVQQHGAGAADAVFAAEMGTGQMQSIAQEIGEVGARLDHRLDGARIDDQRNRGHARASATARRSTAT